LLAGVAAFSVNIMGKTVKTGALVPQPTLENIVSQPAKPLQVAVAAPAAPAAKVAEGLPVPVEQEPTENYDNILTGSLPGQKTDATLSSIVAEPGSMANVPEQPPAELGTESLRLAAEHGDASAQFIIATRYLDGEGTQQDVTRAAHWYQKAATAGLAPAQYRLATLFERGRGMPKDVSSALVWYQRAAEQGNVKSMHNAAVIAAGTEAGKADYGLAFKWFLAASQNGLKDSQFNLAVLYERGLGTKMNSAEALFWYSVAAAQNDADAQKRVDVLSQSLAPVIVDQMRDKAKNWQPLQAPPAANVVTIQDPSWQQTQPLSQLESMPVMGETSENPVGKAQELLTKLGFNVGEPDGKLGARTTNAVRLFQLQSGLKVTGEITSELITQLQAKSG
jgi:localization factor PodJL